MDCSHFSITSPSVFLILTYSYSQSIYQLHTAHHMMLVAILGVVDSW